MPIAAFTGFARFLTGEIVEGTRSPGQMAVNTQAGNKSPISSEKSTRRIYRRLRIFEADLPERVVPSASGVLVG